VDNERQLVARALEKTDVHLDAAARALHITRTRCAKMKKYNLR